MERIQTAIAKARAARSGQDPVAPPPPAATISHAPTADSHTETPPPFLLSSPLRPTDISSAWEALPMALPNRKAFERQRIVGTNSQPGAAAFDVLRTRVMQQMRAKGWRRLGITSPTAGCGKTTLALNLAFGVTRNPELRCMLLEADLRRPSLVKKLGLPPGPDFAKVLKGEADFAQQALRCARNLVLGACAGPARAPAELLQSSTTSAALTDIETMYAPDIMIFDLPPMLAGDDVMAFAGQLDCVLLLAAAETTTVKEIDTCERDLASQTNVLGVVLNKCRYMDRSEDYGSYGE
jgi:protein-tyrosine kinase